MGGGGRAWGGDLIAVVGPGVGHLTDIVLSGKGIFESFFLFGDILIVPFLGPALGWTAMCSPGWGNLVAIDWNGFPVGREFEGKFLKNVKSPPHAVPPSPPAGLTLWIRCTTRGDSQKRFLNRHCLE